jgi:ADP-ribose pyrophosphatase
MTSERLRHPFRETEVRRRWVHRGSAVAFRVDRIRLPDGRPAVREFLHHPGAVAVLPLLGRSVVLVEQFRYPVGRATLELPAGKLAPGERPRDCVRRELREETGYAAGRLRRLFSFWPTPAFSNELLHVYVASALRAGRAAPDDDEFLRVVTLPFEEALRRVFDGRIRDSKTVLALLAWKVRRP